MVERVRAPPDHLRGHPDDLPAGRIWRRVESFVYRAERGLLITKRTCIAERRAFSTEQDQLVAYRIIFHWGSIRCPRGGRGWRRAFAHAVFYLRDCYRFRVEEDREHQSSPTVQLGVVRLSRPGV